MLSDIKNGLYSDVDIHFNGHVIKSHMLYLKKHSKFFDVASKDWFNGSKKLEINFNGIDNKPLAIKIFQNILDIIYDNNLVNHDF